jgi:hypothetical protein
MTFKVDLNITRRYTSANFLYIQQKTKEACIDK